MLDTIKISEVCITSESISQDVADKILLYHILPMNAAQDVLGFKIHCKTSKGLYSGWRPKWWEIQRGRGGSSQHTFKGKGAVDWRCDNWEKNKELFIDYLIMNTRYTRIAVYDNFVHCDYKNANSNRWLYDSVWIRQIRLPNLAEAE